MVEGRNNLLNKMPPKVTLIMVTTLKLVGDTNIANTDSQVVTIGQL
jgi:hypothetical protein